MLQCNLVVRKVRNKFVSPHFSNQVEGIGIVIVTPLLTSYSALVVNQEASAPNNGSFDFKFCISTAVAARY